MRSRRPAMALPFSHQLLLLVLLLLHLLLGCSSQQLSPTDASALLDIRRALRDLPGSDFFSSWDIPSADPCSFAGVTCSSDDAEDPMYLHVSILTLGTGISGSPGLAGNLSASLSNLTSLTDLVIYPGGISGSIPSNIGSTLRRLRLVSISNNLISGDIPASLATLDQLHTLDLSHNRLSGGIPPSLFSSSPSLKVLILASNGLSGELPPDLSASSQLLHIDIRNNALDGVLPPLPSTLQYFSAAANALSGTLTAAFSGGAAPPDLAFLDLSMNVFTGEIPTEILSLPSLSYILLQRNNLSGAVPAPPPAAAAWAVVDLSHNELSGQAPAGLAGAASLFLNSNRFTGAVPEEYTRSVYEGTMTTFYAQQNFLTGFPAPSLPLPEFASVCLAYNCMATPPEAAAGCPAGAGTQRSRPPEQCGGR